MRSSLVVLEHVPRAGTGAAFGAFGGGPAQQQQQQQVPTTHPLPRTCPCGPVFPGFGVVMCVALFLALYTHCAQRRCRNSSSRCPLHLVRVACVPWLWCGTQRQVPVASYACGPMRF